MEKVSLSIVIPTHGHWWELDKTIFSLSKQYGISFNKLEIIIVNTNPEDKEIEEGLRSYISLKDNLRLIQVYDNRAKTISNATFPVNLGVRQYAQGEYLLLAVDAARILTPGVLVKASTQFSNWGDDIIVVTTPYHFLKHSSTPGFTVKECREAFEKTRWKIDVNHLFAYKADTNISSSGIYNEATWMCLKKSNFIKVGGHNEFFSEWSSYNLDLFRRLTRNPPKDGKQIVGKVNDHWGKIGLGLKLKVLEGEADFHLHHSLSDSERNFGVLKQFNIDVWKEYAEVGDCICANISRPNWGLSSEVEEIKFI